MAPIEAELKGATGYGVIEFEFAWTSEQVNKIFKAWGSEGKKKEVFVTYVDFIFILCYSLFMAGCILLVTRKLEGKTQKMGLYFTVMPFIAGIFDVIENIFLLLIRKKYLHYNQTYLTTHVHLVLSVSNLLALNHLHQIYRTW